MLVDLEDEVMPADSETVPHAGCIEIKILKGTDGRCYTLEAMRLTPRDANYVKVTPISRIYTALLCTLRFRNFRKHYMMFKSPSLLALLSSYLTTMTRSVHYAHYRPYIFFSSTFSSSRTFLSFLLERKRNRERIS